LALCCAAQQTLNRGKDETRDLGFGVWSVSFSFLGSWMGVEAVEGASGRARVAAGAAAPRVFQLVTD